MTHGPPNEDRHPPYRAATSRTSRGGEPLRGVVLLCGRSAGMYFPAGINQGLAAALRAPPSGLFIALVIQIPAVTALPRRSATCSNIRAFKPPHHRAEHCKNGVNHTQISEKYDEKVH